jgi:hypothetical protein
LLKSCHEKITFYTLVFYFLFGFAQDKLTYQRFRVSRKSTTNTQTKETPLTAEDVAEFKSLDFFNQRNALYLNLCELKENLSK